MPNSQRQRPPSPDPNDIEADFNSKLARLERDGGLRPPPKLQVTTQLHPFWHTKRGIAVIALVVLALIGAIVGGVIGGTKGKNDGSRAELGTPPTSATTTKSTANTTTSASTSTTSQHSASATKTDSVTTLAARAYPIRRKASYEPLPSSILSLAGFTPVISPAMVIQASPTVTSPPS